MKGLLKSLLALLTIAISVYGINVFGSSIWAFAAIIVAFVIWLSVFIQALDKLAIILALVLSGFSLLFAVLLTLAGFIGGSFHLAESNKVILIAFILMALLGGMFLAFLGELSAKPKKGSVNPS